VIDWSPVEAIGTVAAFLVGFASLAYEWAHRRGREKREQALSVSAWIESDSPEGGKVAVVVLNSSDQPVYKFIALIVMIQGAGWDTGEEAAKYAMQNWARNGPGARYVLPPGTTRLMAGPWEGSDMHKRPGVEIAFTDTAGSHWVRRASGLLEESLVEVEERYDLPIPGVW
jgi:hypothetical protein